MKRSFIADNTLDAIIGLIREAVAFLKENGADSRSLYIGELAMEEILTNIVKYAYEGRPPHQIEVTAEVNRGQIGLEFRDEGTPFDPLSAPPPKFGEPAKTQRMGGRGIYLVKTMVKESSYRREEGRNILSLAFPAKAA